MFDKNIGNRSINMMTAFLLLLCAWFINIHKLIPLWFKQSVTFSEFLYGSFLVWLIVCCVLLALYNLLRKDKL